ncbi:hypothetical protein FOA43_004772 [Brettanomyces nanus]|uniref:Protein kinase domain-containing protein n=1 Tax=Eeniella nana TaxID=13502 RepID=A0A875SD80_EENNA|nr:uncharacterized protein FOA43_004772 [Brettanomyces nanus]QPG77359.1 hypothetical protein FOA43_004772 [Brettanomyces nanus]
MKRRFSNSLNSFNQDEVPSFYKLPTLINRSYREMRELNSIDNEQMVSNEDFISLVREACEGSSSHLGDRKDELPPPDNDNCTDRSISPDKCARVKRRAFSTNEASNFDKEEGRRIERLRHYEFPRQTTSSRLGSHSFEGIEDEYIPDFHAFNLKRYASNENLLDTESARPSPNIYAPISTRELSLSPSLILSPLAPSSAASSSSITNEKLILRGLHSNVKPIDISPKRSKLGKDGFGRFNAGEQFSHSGRSPEREGDRSLLASLPKNFSSLSFSERKKFLSELLPESLKDNDEYKSHLTRLLRKNSLPRSRASSNAIDFLNSFSLEGDTSVSGVSGPAENVNECGSIVMNKWKLGNTFNRGAFGIIRDCQNIEDQSDNRAMKVIEVYDSVEFEQRFKTEILMWSLMQHENILLLQDFLMTNNWFFLLMPKVLGGSLFDIVKMWEAYRIPLNDRFHKIKNFLRGLCKALQYMHSIGAYHGDIKLENCLVDSQNNDRLLLCDFGMANFFTKEGNAQTGVPELTKRLVKLEPFAGRSTSDSELHHRLPDERIGSLPYAAPELIQPSPQNLSSFSDMWAFGIMVYTMVTLKLPFCHRFEPRVKMQIIYCDYDGQAFEKEVESLRGNNYTVQIMENLLYGCLEKDINKRLDATAALALIDQL